MSSILSAIFRTASLFCGFLLASPKFSLFSRLFEISRFFVSGNTDFELELLVGGEVVVALRLLEDSNVDFVVLQRVKFLKIF